MAGRQKKRRGPIAEPVAPVLSLSLQLLCWEGDVFKVRVFPWDTGRTGGGGVGNSLIVAQQGRPVPSGVAFSRGVGQNLQAGKIPGKKVPHRFLLSWKGDSGLTGFVEPPLPSSSSDSGCGGTPHF